MRFKKFPYLLILITGIWLCACDFGDTNINPTTLPDVSVNLILPAAQTQTAKNLTSKGLRVTGAVIQHFKGIESQPETYSSYLIDESTLDQYWRTGLYSAALRDCHLIIEKSQHTSPHYAGMAKVLMAINLGIATSYWGDVPYEEAFERDNDTPKYDEQKQIYGHMQRLLDEALEDFLLPAGLLTPDKDDLIFEGDLESWSKTARALKARYYLHLSKKDEQAAQLALTALDAGPELTASSIPWFPYLDTQNEANPFAIFGEDRPNQLSLGNHLLTILSELRDPRLPKYAVLSNGDYLLYQQGNKDLHWGQFDAPAPLISYTELLFIKSECYLRIGNDAEAKHFYEMAIRSSLSFFEIGQSDVDSYLNELKTWDLDDSPNEKLHHLIQQKYIALFVQGSIESWVDYRRTGFPELQPPTNANESFNPTKVIPRRYMYPISERNANTLHIEEAIARQGGHLLDINVWAFDDD